MAGSFITNRKRRIKIDRMNLKVMWIAENVSSTLGRAEPLLFVGGHLVL
jgi:hypothetical protein